MQKHTPWAKSGTMDPSLKQAIRRYREEAGLTQEACAAASEMSKPGSWSDLEREHGRATPLSLEQLEVVATTIGTTIPALVRKARELRDS